MRVSVEMPDLVWGRLASVADQRGTNISSIIADAVAGLVGMKPVRAPGAPRGGYRVTEAVGERIGVLREQGATWQVIADELGLSVSTVYNAAKRLGLLGKQEAGTK